MTLTRRELLRTSVLPFIGRGKESEGWAESLGRNPPKITIFAEYQVKIPWAVDKLGFCGCKLVGFEDGYWIFGTEERRLHKVQRVKDIVIKDYRYTDLKIVPYFRPDGIITNTVRPLLIRLGVEEYCSHDPSREIV